MGVTQLFSNGQKIVTPQTNENNFIDDCFALRYNKNVDFSEDGRTLTSLTDSWKWALGKNSYSKGVFEFEFEILKANRPVLLGILDQSQIYNLTNLSTYSKGSYGWISGGGSVLVDGNAIEEKDGYNGDKEFLENDTIVLTLNLENYTLAFKNIMKGCEYVLSIPPKIIWRIHVSFYQTNSKIRLSNVKCIA